MKKTYSKPDIHFDSFSLCTNIASCEIKTYTPAQGECGVLFDDFTVFLNGVQGCMVGNGVTIEDGYLNGICYHVPTDDKNLFNS